MLQQLRDSGAGCYAGDVFVGAVSFADDLAILAPSRDGLQKLLDICDRYAASHNLQFSTHPDANKSKTKTVYFPVGRERRPAQLSLCGRLLPWVDQAAHLGHEIHKSGSPELDCNMARGRYIGTSSEVLAMFDFATPEQKLTAIQTYCCSWYGSMLWEFYSDTAEKAFRAWSTTVKIAHQLPRHTRTFIMEHYLSGSLPSVRQMILRRYVQFLQGLLSSSNPAVCHLANLAVATNLSVTGRNVIRMWEEFGRDPVTCHKREFVVEKCEMPEGGEETIELLDRLLEQRSNETDEDVLNELNQLITNVCTRR